MSLQVDLWTLLFTGKAVVRHLNHRKGGAGNSWLKKGGLSIKCAVQHIGMFRLDDIVCNFFVQSTPTMRKYKY